MPYDTIRLFNVGVVNNIGGLKQMNQGKSDSITKRKVQALFKNRQKYKYHNHMQIMLMNIMMSQFRGKGVGLLGLMHLFVALL